MTFLDTAPKLTERRFMRQVVELAGLLGWRAWHDAATNQRSTCRTCKAPLACRQCGQLQPVVRNAAGLLDLILIRRPRVIWAELKSDRAKLTPSQLTTFCELRASGQEAYVWRPSDLEKITRILR
jgi:hypothetical protein